MHCIPCMPCLICVSLRDVCGTVCQLLMEQSTLWIKRMAHGDGVSQGRSRYSIDTLSIPIRLRHHHPAPALLAQQ
jgi:hypothetical protein